MIGGEDGYRCKSVEVKNHRGYTRLQLIACEVERTLQIWKPELAMVEAYALPLHNNINAFVTQVECGTVIKRVLYLLNIPWVEVKPTTLKRWTVGKQQKGKGHASKDVMRDAVAERWGVSFQNHDIVDAFALAQMGQLAMDVLQAIPGVTIIK